VKRLPLALALFALWSAAFVGRWTIVGSDGQAHPSLADDAMISMRYAWNLAHGDGLVYNPGERVEGYSNLLWTLLMALLVALFGREGGVLAVQAAGMLTCLGTLALLPRLVQRLRPRGPAAAPASIVLLVAWYPFAHWPLLGMEAGLLALLVTGAATLVLAPPPAGRAERWRGACLGLLLAAAVLTRADGIVPVAVLLAAFVAVTPRGIPVALAAAVPLGAALAQVLLRVAYYGDVIPNTARLKLLGIPLPVRLLSGAHYVVPFLIELGPVLALVLVATLRRRDRPAATVAALGATALAYQVWVGGDPFPYWRMLVPVMPVAFALAACEMEELAARAATRAGAATRLTLLLSVLAAGWAALPSSRERLLLEEPAAVRQARDHVEMFVRLDPALRDEASLGVLFAGTLPYYLNRLHAVDLLGKADRRVAGLPPVLRSSPGWPRLATVPGHNKYDLRYSILERGPTFVETNRWEAQAVDVEGLYVRAWRGDRSFLLRAGHPAVRWELFGRVTPR
jgi:hypothetical protein